VADGIVVDHSAGRIAGKKVGVPIWKSKSHSARDGFLLDGLKRKDLLTTVPGVAAGYATPPWQ